MAVMKIRNLDKVGERNNTEIDSFDKKAQLLFETVVGNAYANADGITGRSVTLGMLDGYLAEDGTSLDGSIKAQVKAEKERAEEAEQSLQKQLTGEDDEGNPNDPILPSDNLQKQIVAERASREAAVLAEAQARATADGELAAAISTEEREREEADSDLDGRVSANAAAIKAVRNKMGVQTADGSDYKYLLDDNETTENPRSIIDAVNEVYEKLGDHEVAADAHPNITGDDETIITEPRGQGSANERRVFIVKNNGITTGKIANGAVTKDKLDSDLTNRLKRLEDLGEYLGHFDSLSARPSSADSFSHGATVGDFVHVRQAGDVWAFFIRTIHEITGEIQWDSGFKLSSDITGKADKAETEAALAGKQSALSDEALAFIEAFATGFAGLGDGEYKIVVAGGQVSFEPIV